MSDFKVGDKVIPHKGGEILFVSVPPYFIQDKKGNEIEVMNVNESGYEFRPDIRILSEGEIVKTTDYRKITPKEQTNE